LAIDLKSFAAYSGRGEAWAAKKEFDPAIHDFDWALKIDTRSAQAYASRGGTYAAKGDTDRAIADWTKALELAPNTAWLYNGRGVLWNRKHDNDRAAADFHEALRLDPNHAAARQNLAALSSQKGSPAQAPPTPPPAQVDLKTIVQGHILSSLDRKGVAGKHAALASAILDSPQVSNLPVLALNNDCLFGGLACGETDAHGFFRLEVSQEKLRQLSPNEQLVVVVFMNRRSTESGTGLWRLVEGHFVHVLAAVPKEPEVIDLDKGGDLFLILKH